jgi:hypothetical protein
MDVNDASAASLGSTPLRGASLPIGWHNLYFTLDGYAPYELRAQVTEGNTRFRVALSRTTSVRVTSNAGSSLVVIDGDEVGYTPFEISGLRAGRHAFEVRRTGSQTFRRTLMVRAGAVTTVAAVLRPAP